MQFEDLMVGGKFVILDEICVDSLLYIKTSSTKFIEFSTGREYEFNTKERIMRVYT